MNVFFRCDSAPFIGSGHVLRCLSFALYLKSKGFNCFFICRQFDSDLTKFISKNGFIVYKLPYCSSTNIDTSDRSSWLGLDFAIDASQTCNILNTIKCDYLVVDHYGIDSKWETLVNPLVGFLIVVDDLANRYHQCDALIDQNYFKNLNSRYFNLVSDSTLLCLGPAYALVRPQFKYLRCRSLNRRRKSSSFKSILISLGGSDPDNLTQEILSSFPRTWSDKFNINVVVGSLYRHYPSLKRQLIDFKSIKLFRQTEKMHTLMYYSDFAITSGGSITWEKFTLGLPSFAIPSDIYEAEFSSESSKMGAQLVLQPTKCNFKDDLRSKLYEMNSKNRLQMSTISAALCDGNGAAAVHDKIMLSKTT